MSWWANTRLPSSNDRPIRVPIVKEAVAYKELLIWDGRCHMRTADNQTCTKTMNKYLFLPSSSMLMAINEAGVKTTPSHTYLFSPLNSKQVKHSVQWQNISAPCSFCGHIPAIQVRLKIRWHWNVCSNTQCHNSIIVSYKDSLWHPETWDVQ